MCRVRLKKACWQTEMIYPAYGVSNNHIDIWEMRLGRRSMQHQKLGLAATLNQSPIVAGALQMSKPTTTRCVTPPSKERCYSQPYHMNVGKRWSCSIEIIPIPSSVITDVCSKCVCVCGRKKSERFVPVLLFECL